MLTTIHNQPQGPDQILIARCNGKKVGWLNLRFGKRSRWLDPDDPIWDTDVFGEENCVAVIADITIQPEYQRLGIGTQLINTARKLAQTKGCPQIYLRAVTVNSNNPPNGFFQRQGFTTIKNDLEGNPYFRLELEKPSRATA